MDKIFGGSGEGLMGENNKSTVDLPFSLSDPPPVDPKPSDGESIDVKPDTNPDKVKSTLDDPLSNDIISSVGDQSSVGNPPSVDDKTPVGGPSAEASSSVDDPFGSVDNSSSMGNSKKVDDVVGSEGSSTVGDAQTYSVDDTFGSVEYL